MKKVIRKIAFFLLITTIGSGIVVLLVASNRLQEQEECRGVVIELNSQQDNYFVDQNDINNFLIKEVGKNITNKKISELNLQQLEMLLETNSWVKAADMWVDHQNSLHIKVIERTPIARIFNNDGTSFYIDSAKQIMPLSSKMNVRIPVFVGMESSLKEIKNWQLTQAKELALFLSTDSFWNSQIAQIEFSETGIINLIPTVGNHIIRFGTCENMDKKFKKLFLLYKQILSKVGFDVYSIIDVQFEKQLIGVKPSTEKRVFDSAQLKQKIEAMLMNPMKDSLLITSPVIKQNLIINNN